MASSSFDTSAEKIGTEANTAPLNDLWPPFMAAFRTGRGRFKLSAVLDLEAIEGDESLNLLNRPDPLGSVARRIRAPVLEKGHPPRVGLRGKLSGRVRRPISLV